jgi:hypothetical protein
VLVTVAASRTAGHGGPVPEALTAGFDLGFLIAGGLFLLVVVIAGVVLPRVTPAHQLADQRKPGAAVSR